MQTTRRQLLAFAGIGAVAAPLLSACGGGGPSGAEGASSVRFAWWGGAERQELYLKAIDQFQAGHGSVQIAPEFADYDAFQERMTTQIAARDVPEVFWIPSPQVMTYGDAGLYRRLDDIESFDLSDFTPEDLESFKLGGELNTFPKSVFTSCVRYNQTFLDEDGVELPSGADWTWDRLADFLIDYSANNGSGRKGTSYNAYSDMGFEAWLRQRGADLWTEDGRLGADADDFASWLDWWERVRKGGGSTDLSEQEGAQPEWSVVGDKVLATFANTNHIIDEAAMFPDSTFDMVEVPVAEGAADGHAFLYYSRLAVYSGTDDALLGAVGEFVDYNINSLDMLKLVGLSAGAPPNPRLLEAAKEGATEDEVKVLEITARVRDAERRPRYEAPSGSGTWRDVMVRAIEEVALGGANVMDAATSAVADISAAIER